MGDDITKYASCWFDYGDPSSYRLYRITRPSEASLYWRPFALAKQKDEAAWAGRAPEDLPVSVIALLMHELVRKQQGQDHRFNDFMQEMFSLWHERDNRPNDDELIGLALGYLQEDSPGQLDFEGAILALESSHREAVERGISGTPTVMFEKHNGVRLAIESLPEAFEQELSGDELQDAADGLWYSLRDRAASGIPVVKWP